MNPRRCSNGTRSGGFTLVELLVVIAIIGLLVGLLLPAVQAAREAARRMQCSNNLHQIGIATHNYESAHRQIPIGWIETDQDGRPGWGWAVALLPFIESNNLYQQIDSRLEIVNSIHADAVVTSISTFICPSDTGELVFELLPASSSITTTFHPPDPPVYRPIPIAKSNYVGMFGTLDLLHAGFRSDGIFFGNSKVKFRDVTDGLSNTIMIGERCSRIDQSIWPGVIPFVADARARILGVADHTPNHPSSHFDDFSSYHTGGANFLKADGSTSFLSENVDLAIFRALATRAGGEVHAADL